MMFIMVTYLVTIVISGAERTRITCDPGWYYDSVISRCDTCDSICDHAEIQGTVADCLHRCPGFISGALKPTDTTRWPTSPPASSNEYKWTQQSTLALLISLSSICVLLVTIICVVMCIIFKKHVILYQRTNSTVSHDDDSMRTDNSEGLLLEGQSAVNFSQMTPDVVRTETV